MENCIILAPLLLIVYISHKVIDRQFAVKMRRCRYRSSPLPGEGVCDAKGESSLSNRIKKEVAQVKLEKCLQLSELKICSWEKHGWSVCPRGPGSGSCTCWGTASLQSWDVSPVWEKLVCCRFFFCFLIYIYIYFFFLT